MLLLLVGASACWLGLARLRARFLFETFQVEAPAPIPVERVRLRNREPYPVDFLLLHGYGANRRQLLQLAEALAAAGADVYVPDLPGRGDHTGPASLRPAGGPHPALPTPRETEAALAVLHHLERHFGVRREQLVLIGHSLGGGVALDLARRTPPAATVSLAGLLRPVGPGQPPNLFLVTARFEIPPLRRAADQMYARARTGRSPQASSVARGEFFCTHSTLPNHSGVQRAIVNWARRALPPLRGGARLAIPPRFNESLLALELAGLFCLTALFVPLAALAGGWLACEPFGEVVAETRLSFWSPVHLAGYGLLTGAAAVSAIRLLNWLGWPHPLAFLRLADGDYLCSVLLLSCVGLLPLLRHRPWVRSWRETAASIAAAVGLAAYLIVVGGGFLTWQLFDLWPTPGRWARMLLLAPLLFLYALGEELLQRTFSKQERGRALTTFLVWRLALLAGILYGALVLASGEGMLLLMTIPLLLLSLLEYFFAAVVYDRLGSVYAGATLKTLLMSWFIAAFFPLR